jgi:hypothetical protein
VLVQGGWRELRPQLVGDDRVDEQLGVTGGVVVIDQALRARPDRAGCLRRTGVVTAPLGPRTRQRTIPTGIGPLEALLECAAALAKGA